MEEKKSMMKEIRNENFKQIIDNTKNLYFHKTLTYTKLQKILIHTHSHLFNLLNSWRDKCMFSWNSIQLSNELNTLQTNNLIKNIPLTVLKNNWETIKFLTENLLICHLHFSAVLLYLSILTLMFQ